MGISRNFNNIHDILPKIKFIKQTSNDYSRIKNQIIDFSPDAIIHFAWNGGNSYSDFYSTDQFTYNIPLMASLLNVIKEAKIKSRFIGIGSFFEYGLLEARADETNPENPQTYYGMAKKQTKEMSKLFCDLNDLKWTWIRPSNVYGEGDAKTRIIPKVISNLLENKQVNLDSCSTKLDYIHIDDFSRGIMSILHTQSSSGIFNICSGKEYELKSIIELILSKMTDRKNLVYFDAVPERKNFSKYLCGINTKICETTGWKPSISVDDGITRIINYIKEGN